MELLLGLVVVGLVLLLVVTTSKPPAPANLTDDALMLEIQAVNNRLVGWGATATEPSGTTAIQKRANTRQHFLALLQELETRDAHRYQQLLALAGRSPATPDEQSQAISAYFLACDHQHNRHRTGAKP